ncbi:hypothetical protein QQ008_27185 [Fulvivirgaceae bacterium BMA10]|uniref:Uncharacterized protein n=1 Tax=Splendidivirga corallicola TaxID=3051826 RepID=A0ABT8KWD0_9BACT|nr:hypothetical protein [Fulvivirgaceae bacterium BMA10]
MRTIVILFVFSLIFLFEHPKVQAQTVTLSNTSIEIDLPEGFEVATQFSGLIHKGTATTVMGLEKENTSYLVVSSAMDEQYFADQDLTLLNKENISFNGHEGILFTCAFTVDSVAFERMIFLTGDHNNAKVVIANYPEIAKIQLASLVKDCITKIKF